MPICQQEWMIPADDGSRIYLKEKWREAAGRGPAVLMVHGYNGLGSLGNYDIPVKDFSGMDFLAARGYDVFALDMRGFGRSSRPEGLRVEDNVADVGVAADFICKERGEERIGLLGGSYGGPIAFTYAGRHADRVERLVLMGTPYRRMRDEGREMLKALIVMAEDRRLTYVSMPATQQPDKAVVETDPEFLKWRFEASQAHDSRVPIPPVREMLTFAAAEAVPGVVVPTLLVLGDSDIIASIEDNLALLRDLGSSEKSLVIVGNAGHSLMYETKHAYVWSLVCQGLPPVAHPPAAEN